MPIRKLWGVGEVMGRELARLGIETIGDLARWPREELVARFGVARRARGCTGPATGWTTALVTPEHEAKSLSREETFARDIRDAEMLRRELLRLSDEVAWRLRRHQLQARTVNLKLRYGDFSTLTRQVTLPDATDSGPVLYSARVSAVRQGLGPAARAARGRRRHEPGAGRPPAAPVRAGRPPAGPA